LTYRAVGSSTGQREFTQQTSGDFTAGLTDFAAGDIPMDPSALVVGGMHSSTLTSSLQFTDVERDSSPIFQPAWNRYLPFWMRIFKQDSP
jgi:hypothetical protein